MCEVLSRENGIGFAFSRESKKGNAIIGYGTISMPSLPAISVFTPEWLDAPERPRFSRGEIHLWRANLDQPHLRVLATETLSIRDAIRAGRQADARERARDFAMTSF